MISARIVTKSASIGTMRALRRTNSRWRRCRSEAGFGDLVIEMLVAIAWLIRNWALALIS